MQTVNFQCGHCKNLMAVGADHLGQQVRCPHCQQVVVAPAAPGPAPAAPPGPPAIQVPGRDETESIFTPPESATDDLFGGAPAPLVELPTEPAFPPMSLDQLTAPDGPAVAVPPPPDGPDDRTLTYTGPAPDAVATEVLSPADGAAAPAGEGPGDDSAEDESLSVPVQKVRVPRSSPWVIPLVIVPLIFYSVCASAFIAYLMLRDRSQPHPLEVLPDVNGDNKGGAKRGKQSFITMPDPDSPLGPKMIVPLGQPLAVGDLEVTPEKVERTRIAYDIPGFNPEKARDDSLVLHLRLRNRSADVTFKPMDRYFVRAWSKEPGAVKPYTFLEMGDRKFYGGALRWVSLADAKAKSTYVEYVEGQKVNTELKPGDEMRTFVCTNPDDKAAKALEGYDGPLLWRVQLRRGLVRWTAPDGAERDDPATTVVGVEFAAGDVKKAVN